MLHLIELVAPSDSTVLITGETGSRKRAGGQADPRAQPAAIQPFVVVECAALQESLLQSELFGHERGAFTGADRAKPGLFEVANGGTIFLDEIGEVSPATQVKLLRVLDTSTFRHVGGTAEIHVDVRVLAATNRDVPAMVRQGAVPGGPVLPALHDQHGDAAAASRGTDIELLARHFVALNERFGSANGSAKRAGLYGVILAGQCARTAARGRGRDGRVRGRRDPAGAPAGLVRARPTSVGRVRRPRGATPGTCPPSTSWSEAHPPRAGRERLVTAATRRASWGSANGTCTAS